MTDAIKWCNDNSGFLSLILFGLGLLLGWISGLFKSLIRKPRLTARFIEKMSFYSFFYTGKEHRPPGHSESFALHKTGFVVYISIANIGSATTSIDKIHLGYTRNSPRSWFRRRQWEWLAQWHSGVPFMIPLNDDQVMVIPSLRTRVSLEAPGSGDRIDVGGSLIGAAYFEQPEAWGNLNPMQGKSEEIHVKIRIHDIYRRTYTFKTTLSQVPIEKAREYNEHFGDIERITNV